MKENKKEIDDTQTITVPVLGGEIRVTVCGDPDYPGVDVEYIADNDEGQNPSRPRVTMEMTMVDESSGLLRALAWTDPGKEDYTEEISFGRITK